MTLLYGRDAEQKAIGALLDQVTGLDGVAGNGAGGALLLTGDPGIGKTALLGFAEAEAVSRRMLVLRATAVESESELPYATLHLLLGPYLRLLGQLPVPQRAALEVAFGVSPGPAPDRLLTGLGTLTLLTELAADRPVLCLLDDAHWMDRASADALLIVMRRLQADPVAVIGAARGGERPPDAPDLGGITLVEVPPLTPSAAAALLAGQAAQLAPADQYRVLAYAHGNPLALTELPRLAPEEEGNLLPLTSRLQLAFHGSITKLPARTQTLLLTAALAEDGDLATILAAGASLGAGAEDLEPAVAAGLVIAGALSAQGGRLEYRHPLVRAAVRQRAPLADRIAVHRALAAAVTDASPDAGFRRVWHLALAASGPDDELAAALQRTAVQARARGGHAAAASAYERAARLSVSPADVTERLMLAAEAALDAGELTRAERLVARAGDGSRATKIQGITEFLRGSYPAAHRLLGQAADQSAEPAEAARLLLQDAHVAWYLGEAEVADVIDRLTALRFDDDDPLAPLVEYFLPAQNAAIGRYERPVPPMREAVTRARSLGARSPADLVLVCGATFLVGDDEGVHELATELVAEARAQGASGQLPVLLFFLAEAELFLGRHRDAVAGATESLRIAADTGQRQWAGQMHAFLSVVAAVEGDAERCRELSDEALSSPGAGAAVAIGVWATWAAGLLDLGEGRAQDALTRLHAVVTGRNWYHVAGLRAIPDLVEAAVRAGVPEQAGEQLARFERWVAYTGQPWGHALAGRCRALLAPDEQAEALFTAALDAHPVHDRPFERARTQLCYGEWLRRTRRRSEARAELAMALEVFVRLGAAPWARRAQTELDACGGQPAQTAEASALTALTPQELQVVRLAAGGMSNRDIAAQLFLSPRTVGYHLYKAYPKLGIASRAELPGVLGE
jgi:DNA-binding CsgD family transcriptional regulator